LITSIHLYHLLLIYIRGNNYKVQTFFFFLSFLFYRPIYIATSFFLTLILVNTIVREVSQRNRLMRENLKLNEEQIQCFFLSMPNAESNREILTRVTGVRHV